MQPFGGALSEREIRSLVVLIRELSEKAKVEGGKREAPAIDAVFKSERQAFKLETVFDGLDTPWGFAFLPDKRVIVTERPGRLRILTPGQPLAEPIRGLPRVWLQQDSGLLDIALDPDYATNGWIYLGYSVEGANRSSMTTIVRGHVRDGAWVDQEFIYKPPADVYRTGNDHYGTRIVFDTAGHLFYSIGDRGVQQEAEPAPVRSTASCETAACPDNPFVGRAGATRRSGATATATRRASPSTGDGESGLRARTARRRRA
jgi:glucose/arabinose dehydrogenase